MKVILKYLRPFALFVALAICLLGAQAIGELNMPNLMSNIVNTGLQGGGIAEDMPNVLTPQAMQFITAFMTPQDAQRFQQAYTLDGETYACQAQDKDTADIYNRAAYFFLEKAMAAMEQSGQALPAGDSVNLEDASMDSLYLLGTTLQLQPGLQQELAAAAAQPMDGQIASQVGKQMITLFYRDAGLDTAKIQRQYIYKVGAQMILLALGCGLAAVCVSLLSSRIAAGFSRNLRRAVFTKVQGFSKAEIDRFSIASLITRSTNDVQQVQMVVLMGIRVIVFAPIMGFGGTIMALQKSLSLSWVIVLAIAILICTLVLVMIIVMPKFKSLQALIDRLNLVSRENLTGLMVVRAFSNEAHEEQRFDQAAYKLARTERFVNRSMSALMPLMSLLMNGMSMLVVWFGAKAIQESTLQIGDLLAFIQYSMHIVFSFVFIAMMFVFLPRAGVSAGRIREVLETPLSILEPEQPETLTEGPIAVRFDHVSFRYDGAEEDVLQDISFTAKPGQTTAFIGATGAGKSSLASLIERFYDVTEGAITFNDVDIRTLPQAELRSHIGYVPQSAVLFSGTVRSNVNYNEESDPLPEQDIQEALQTAQAEDFVQELEDGLEAFVAQGGSNFSGGQKQRLSIARALARRPGVYIFDDSFSALDFKTDAALRRALSERTGAEQATVFIVAQRVSTILTADQIIVLDEGRIAGIGTHKQLLENCTIYREIAESQLSQAELHQ